MVKKQDIRDARLEEQKRKMAEDRKLELSKMPMNKYLGEGTELGSRIMKFRLSDYETVHTAMRKVKIFYAMLRGSKVNIDRLKKEILMGTPTDDKGSVISVDKAKVLILEEEARIQGCLADIRIQVGMDNLMKCISETEFTSSHYEQYVKHVEEVLYSDGYNLFPEEYQIIPLK